MDSLIFQILGIIMGDFLQSILLHAVFKQILFSVCFPLSHSFLSVVFLIDVELFQMPLPLIDMIYYLFLFFILLTGGITVRNLKKHL